MAGERKALGQLHVERIEAAHEIAIDYFGRTAGLGPRDEDFVYMPHVEQTTVDQVHAMAAIAALRQRTGAGQIVSVGFCLGGLHSFLAGTSAPLDLAGVIGFYGLLDGSRLGIEGPLQRAADIRCPVLGLFGGADEAIPVEQVDEFDSRLIEAGVEHELKVYPAAPHSFFDKRAVEHAEASDDAWRRVLAFLDRRGST
jgi:carboxymethylenebutenolidase